MTAGERTSTFRDNLGIPPLQFDPIVGLRVRGTGTMLRFPDDEEAPMAMFRLGAGEVELPLAGEFISKVHCTLEPCGDRVRVRDVSKNGTFVDGVRQADFYLSPGGMFQVGAIFLIAITARACAAESTLGEILGTKAHDAVDRALRAGMQDESIAVLGEPGTSGREIATLLHGISPHQHRVLEVPTTIEELDRATRWFAGGIVADVATLPGVVRTAPWLATVLANVASGALPVYAIAASARNLVEQLGLRFDAAHTLEPPVMRHRNERLEILAELLKARSPSRALADLGPENLARLAAYRWPKNLDELRAAVPKLEAILAHPESVRTAATSIGLHHSTLQEWLEKLQLTMP